MFSLDYSVLVIAEPDFQNKGKDCTAYVDKLKGLLEKRADGLKLRVMTVTGKYGVPGFDAFEVDDKNKTSFVKSVDEKLESFNDIVTITNFEKDPYIDVIANRAGELSITFTIYGYEIKEHEES